MSSSQKIFNRMSIFRRWKFQSRHTKLTEEWALATSTKDLSEINDEQQEDDQNVTKFSLKYLGKTSIDAERSQNATAEAIKSVITNSKTLRSNNNNKKSQRVHLIVCPKGIEMRDEQTDDILLRVSIYKISYCSADAAHDHVFAFIGSENDKDSNDEKLSCYVFLCPKRRIAHDVTLTVARCFENAYQNWRNSIEHKMFSSKTNNNKTLSSLESSIDGNKLSSSSSQNGSTDNLLIDLTQEGSNSNSNSNTNTNKTTEICEKNHRNYLQNTWVSFDDEQIDVRQQLFQENSSWDTQQLVF